MKLSENTKKVFQNFATVGQNFLLQKGTEQRMRGNGGSVLIEADLEEDFPVEAPIYDLSPVSKFIKSFDDTEVEVNETSLLVKSGEVQASFGLCDKEVLTVPLKKFNMTEVLACFEINVEQFKRLEKVMGLFKEGEKTNFFIYFEGDGSEIYATVQQVKNAGAELMKVKICDSSLTFKFLLNSRNFKMMSDSYEVSYMERGSCLFASKTNKYKYFLATEVI